MLIPAKKKKRREGRIYFIFLYHKAETGLANIRLVGLQGILGKRPQPEKFNQAGGMRERPNHAFLGGSARPGERGHLEGLAGA